MALISQVTQLHSFVFDLRGTYGVKMNFESCCRREIIVLYSHSFVIVVFVNFILKFIYIKAVHECINKVIKLQKD